MSSVKSSSIWLPNRRQALVASGVWLAAGSSLVGQESKSKALVPLNRFPRMVQEHFVDQVRKAEQRGLTLKSGLKTKADAEAYVLDVRAKIVDAFGTFPERTPLNPKVTGVVERDSYRIEKVLFESRPDFLVTANLYIPKGRQFPLPGVVGSCGHSVNGKAAEAYQSFAQGLARLGYIVLIFDPIGQGERMQAIDAQGKPRRGVGTSEHLHAGNPQFLVGDFFGSWRAWDGIRALDYLLTREEVDPKHVGVTGNSGGGTMTTWLCGLESRWTMAAPACFVTTFRRNMENELPADTEQCPPKVLALGLDHDDFIAAMAPKPVVILAKERDFFDVRGAQEAYARLKRLYELLGKPENISLHIGPTEHGYTQENREAMYRWFNRVTGVSKAQTEPAITIEKDETLWVVKGGQVGLHGSRSLYSFTQARAEALAQRQSPPDAKTLKIKAAELLKLPLDSSIKPKIADSRILRPPSPGRAYPKSASTTYAVETEPGVFALTTRLYNQSQYSRPPRAGKGEKAILYVSHHSADAELREEPLVRETIARSPNAAFFACDPRGVGDSRPDSCGGPEQFLRPYGSDYFYAIHSIMLDRPYLGQRTFDVLRVLDWIMDHGHEEIELIAKGWGTLPAAFAALFRDQVKSITLKGALKSYHEIATKEEYSWPLSSFLPNVLQHFDLPDLYRILGDRLRMI